MNPEHFSASGGKYEPTSVARAFARTLRDQYMALTAEGFTEAQALQIVGTILAAHVHAAHGNSGS